MQGEKKVSETLMEGPLSIASFFSGTAKDEKEAASRAHFLIISTS